MPKKRKDSELTGKAASSDILDGGTIGLESNIADEAERFDLSREDYEKLHSDAYWRTLNNPNKTSSALVLTDPRGKRVARQYFPPAEDDTGSVPGDDSSSKAIDADESTRPRKTVVSAFRPIQQITEIEPFDGVIRYRATTPGGTDLIGRRKLPMTITDGDSSYRADLVSFSPTPANGRVWWGGPGEPEQLVREGLKGGALKEVEDEIREAGAHVKCGVEMDVELPGVAFRKGIKSRKPDQNTVMHGSAKDAYDAFYQQFEDILDENLLEKMKRSIDAPLRGMFDSNHRPEWLHGYGFGLTPEKLQPQTEHNLGAAPKWCNTEMMIAEYIGQFLAQVADEKGMETVSLKILPVFKMFFDSDIIRHIEYHMRITMGERTISIDQEINPFANALFRKKVDVALGTVNVIALLNGDAPDAELKVYFDSKRQRSFAAESKAESGVGSSSERRRDADDDGDGARSAAPLRAFASHTAAQTKATSSSSSSVHRGKRSLEEDNFDIEDVSEPKVKKSRRSTRLSRGGL
jgi:hypothetical protein